MLMGRFHLFGTGYSMIRKSGHRFSLGKNAKRLPGDHAQTSSRAPGGGQMLWRKHGQARPENQIWVEMSDLPRSEIARKHKS
ncbi:MULTISPECIES: hypothetical protein [unclassified Bradyrhizobium]|uniref:hypothetical protein n=1 Tax=unclassified Bradyrhizobium TaxID=2631580 RepID=UPI002FF2D1C2